MFKSVLVLAAALHLCSPLHAAQTPMLAPMVALKAGSFAMGGAGGAPNPDYPHSEPIHTVQVKAFKLAQYEVTVGQFRQFVEATGYKTEPGCWELAKTAYGMDGGAGAWNSPANAPSDYHPVMCVSWDDAHAYVQWLSAQTGRRFRLPSEAEWEYAARAGGSGAYPWGEDSAQLCRFANVYDRTGKAGIEQITGLSRAPAPCDDGAALTQVVGMYQANAFGLYDMLGNVGEYVEDCQHQNYVGAPNDGSAWTSQCKDLHGSKMAINRGGSYNSGVKGALVFARGHAGLDNRSSMGEGFRLAEDGSDGTPAAGGFERGLAQAQLAARAK